MSTLFYQDHFNRTIPLTGLFLERLGVLVSEKGKITTDEEMLEVLSRAMVDAELVKKPSDEQLVYMAQALEDYYKEKEEKVKEAEGKKATGKGKHFAGYFSEWASELDYDKLCLYVAGYDYTKAREYFKAHDQRSILAIADEKLRLEFELARVSFEAALFGFGGGYKDTPKEGDVMFDLTQDGQHADNALKELGF